MPGAKSRCWRSRWVCHCSSGSISGATANTSGSIRPRPPWVSTGPTRSELRYFDDLLGGRNEWRYAMSSTKLWSLLRAKFVIIPDTLPIPGYHRILGPVPTASGSAYLYEADTVPPYARVVPAALKVDNDSAIPPTLADPRMPGYGRVVLFTHDAPVNPTRFTAIPPASASSARVTAWDARARGRSEEHT